MMDANQVAELRRFVEQLKSNPSILHDPSLVFFKEYLRRSLFPLCLEPFLPPQTHQQ
ncbi:unnamed protein product, partial [Thlaspi arvense]